MTGNAQHLVAPVLLTWGYAERAQWVLSPCRARYRIRRVRVLAWCVSGRRVDFCVSHAGRDTAWAEWLAWQLGQAGYRVERDVWDWAPGEDFVARNAVVTIG
jgi:hypothetical protein